MEPSSDLFSPWRLYTRAGWAALAGSLVSVGCGFFSPLAFLPAALMVATMLVLLWLALRPPICVSASQINVGERAVAWQEIRAVNHVFSSPLFLRLRLTNNRQRLIVFPGKPERIAQLVTHIRNRSFLATFDGIPYRDYHVWSNLSDSEAEQLGLERPVPMISSDEEQEIERLYQKLKSVGNLDSAGNEDGQSSHEG